MSRTTRLATLPKTMMLRKLLPTLLATSLCLFAASCKNKKKGDDFSDAAGYGQGGAGSGYDQYRSGSNINLPSRRGGASFSTSSKGQFAPIYFAFDSFQVSSAEMGKIQQVASYAKSSGAELIVAGFADSVGTEEYNRGLGDRRALAVRSALVNSGVSSGKIQTVSFGEEMLADPANPSSGRNRRVEFGIVR